MANTWALINSMLAQRQPPQRLPTQQQPTQTDLAASQVQPLPLQPVPQPLAPQPLPPPPPSMGWSRLPAAMPQTPSFDDRIPQNKLQLLEEQFGTQQGDVDKIRAQAEAVENGPQKVDLSPLAALASAWGGQEGKAVASAYEKPMSKEDRATLSAKLRSLAGTQENAISKDRLQLLLGGDKNDISALKSLVGAQIRGTASADKEDKEFSKQERVMREALFFQGRTAPEIRNSIAKLQRATQAIALMDSIPNGTPTPGEMSNLATAMAGLATNGNIITNEKLKEILPHNVKLSAAGISQWISSNPHGADQTKWMERFRREIDQETRVARETLAGYQQDQADAMQGLTRPDRHKQIFDAAQNFVNSRYYNPDKKKPSAAANDFPADWDEAKKKKYLELKAKAAAK